MIEKIKKIIEEIESYDELEKSHIKDALLWIQVTDDIYRREKPKVPNKHLVSYFILFDKDQDKVLLVGHRKAGLLLPSGGHVEIDEDPVITAKRECKEELFVEPQLFFDNPIFITVTDVKVVGKPESEHTDVSLWYVFEWDSDIKLDFDKREFTNIYWFTLDEILQKNISEMDPSMHRFVRKLKQKVLNN